MIYTSHASTASVQLPCNPLFLAIMCSRSDLQYVQSCDMIGAGVKNAVICLFTGNSRLFMVRHTRSQRYGLPGGKINSGETPWQAAVREFREETGFQLPSDARASRSGSYVWRKHTAIFLLHTSKKLSIGPVVNGDGEVSETCIPRTRTVRAMLDSGSVRRFEVSSIRAVFDAYKL
ncbi:MutT/nudix family protein [Elysia marginata]|uniref:MutT/nudix family protein n=1 Tax=Elysia marginata TaxID=1093978 RepID=A0AAV4GW11_9GAST|nr:MutT/nudix family protein [Elysia marginata]